MTAEPFAVLSVVTVILTCLIPTVVSAEIAHADGGAKGVAEPVKYPFSGSKKVVGPL